MLVGRAPVSIVSYTTEQDFITYVEEMARGGIDAAFIEKVNAFPGQGVASTWKFAQKLRIRKRSC
jgi:hypothetical protein